MKLLSINNDSKTSKGLKRGFLTGILYLAPANTALMENVCAKSTPGCRDSCLFTAGRGVFSSVRRARIARTKLLFRHRERFLELLYGELEALKTRARRLNLRPAARLNGTSDLPWLGRWGADRFPDIMFYDYTKIPRPWEREAKNYRLTFSRSESNGAECLAALEFGVNVAAVFRGPWKRGETLYGRRVLNGDRDDLRFLDPRTRIVGLKAKGRAKKDQTGFVIQNV